MIERQMIGQAQLEEQEKILTKKTFCPYFYWTTSLFKRVQAKKITDKRLAKDWGQVLNRELQGQGS